MQRAHFSDEDFVVVILKEKPSVQRLRLDLQDFKFSGRPMIPVFTSMELFKKVTHAKEFPYHPIKVKFAFLKSFMSGTETIIVNPGTQSEYVCNVRDLEREVIP